MCYSVSSVPPRKCHRNIVDIMSEDAGECVCYNMHNRVQRYR